MVDLECRRLDWGMQPHNAKRALFDVGEPVGADPGRRSIGHVVNRRCGRNQVPLQVTDLQVGLVPFHLAPDAKEPTCGSRRREGAAGSDHPDQRPHRAHQPDVSARRLSGGAGGRRLAGQRCGPRLSARAGDQQLAGGRPHRAQDLELG